MALDGIMLHYLTNEIKNDALHGKVSQVYQPNRDELVLTIRTKERGNQKLLLSCRANSPRIHFTQFAPENPATPPMLCMLLRKKLIGGTLTDVRQRDTERIMFLDFMCTNELGDKVKLTLIIEIMGKYSNIILIDEQELIIDSLKRVDLTMSRERAVLPNLKYELPPPQNKLCIINNSSKEILSKIKSYPQQTLLSKALLNSIEGVSPILSRELTTRITKDLGIDDIALEYLDGNRQEIIINVLDDFRKNVIEYSSAPTIVFKENNTPFDICSVDVMQYGDFYEKKHYDSFSIMLDNFYSEKDLRERMKIKSADLHKILSNTIERLSRKVVIQQKEIKKCEKREELRVKGDLLQANLYRCNRGDSFIDVENFYDNNKMIRIALNPTKTPAQNSQKFYKDYQKAKTGEKVLSKQIEKANAERLYLEAVLDNLCRAESLRDLSEIRVELTEQGYIKDHTKGKKQKQSILPPREYKITNDSLVLVGRNNKQNDMLTFKTANKTDIWFHTKDIPGSHTILFTNGKEPSEEDLMQTAQIAAFHSKAREGMNVPVDYTYVKYVSKPNGAKPGMVIFVNNRTLYVNPKLPN